MVCIEESLRRNENFANTFYQSGGGAQRSDSKVERSRCSNTQRRRGNAIWLSAVRHLKASRRYLKTQVFARKLSPRSRAALAFLPARAVVCNAEHKQNDGDFIHLFPRDVMYLFVKVCANALVPIKITTVGRAQKECLFRAARTFYFECPSCFVV
jgi:hypothetical protein